MSRALKSGDCTSPSQKTLLPTENTYQELHLFGKGKWQVMSERLS